MGEWLADTLEGVEAMAGLLEKARAAPKMAVQEIHSYALGLTDLTSELIEQVKSRGAAGRSSEAKPHGRTADPRPLTPPVSNTGGKVPKKPKKGG